MSASKGSKLRRSRTVDPSHKGRWICKRIPIFRDFVGGSPINFATRIAISRNAKSRRPKGQCGARGVSEADRWRTIDTESNSIDHFGFLRVKVPKALHQDS
jgi:hypothetical protein